MDHRNYGNFLFVRNIEGNELWSTTHYPLIKEADGYRVIFSEDKAEFIRNDGNIETHTEVVVSPEHPVEIRHVTLTNHGTEDLELEVTSYAELILAPNPQIWHIRPLAIFLYGPRKRMILMGYWHQGVPGKRDGYHLILP